MTKGPAVGIAPVLLVLALVVACAAPPEPVPPSPPTTVASPPAPSAPTPTVVPATATTLPPPTATPAPSPSPASSPTVSTAASPSGQVAASVPVASPSVAPSSTELRLVAQGFGQAGDSVGFAFVVKNTSPSLVTGPTGYVVTAYNAAGAVVRTGGGTIGVVLPGQQQGVAGALAVPSTSPVARIDVKLEPPAFHFPWTADPRALATTAVALRRDSSLATASGIVTNSGAIGFDGAIVSAIAYNATGQIVGGGATTTGPIPPNGRVSVDVPITTSIPPIQLELYAAPRALPAPHVLRFAFQPESGAHEKSRGDK